MPRQSETLCGVQANPPTAAALLEEARATAESPRAGARLQA